MTKGVHTMFYTSDPAGRRNFLQHKLQLKSTDAGKGWLIFDLPEADMGCYPDDLAGPSGTHNISFYCDIIGQTVRELRDRCVKFTDKIQDRAYGSITHFELPGNFSVQLYQPKYKK